jgi:hypothetical protein
VNGPSDNSRIYLLSEGERQVSPNGPAVIGPDGVRQDIPPLVFKAVTHVIEALRAGNAVKVVPLRSELPVDEAAAAIGMDALDFRSYVADGEIPFRSSEHVDWVRLEDVLGFDRRLSEQRHRAIQELLDEPLDDDDA